MTGSKAEIIAAVDEALDSLLPNEDMYPPEIHRAMRYSVFAGGKRLRPLLVISAADIFAVPLKHALPVACAIEMVHTYSLIHDDLPSMDNDDYRRGRPANHKVFGEAIALLAGDALLTAAFATLAGAASACFPAETVIELQRELAQAAGTSGMIGGQVVDILSEGKAVDGQTLDYIHFHKTAALITCCVRSGAIMGQASPEQLQALTGFGRKIGLAFQIVDDILDVTGDEKLLGKKTGADAGKQKATYPALYGLEAARKKAAILLKEALECLKPFGPAAENLKELARYAIMRNS